MINQAILIGTIKEDFKEIKIGNNNYFSTIIEVRRSFKNHNGEYDYDLIIIYFWDEIIKHLIKRLYKDKQIAVKARIENINNVITIIGEKVTIMA